MADLVKLTLKVRKTWWCQPVMAAALLFPALWPLALSGIRVEVSA